MRLSPRTPAEGNAAIIGFILIVGLSILGALVLGG